jgi:hypothetical protein
LVPGALGALLEGFSLPGAIRVTYVGNLRERSFFTVCIGCKLCRP